MIADRASLTLAQAGDIVSYRLGRLDRFDDPRLAWAIVAGAAALAALYVGWMYRRESGALPSGMSFVLAGLRLTAVAGLIVFFLDPQKRADQQVVAESRVAILVDASQSMAVADEAIGDEPGQTRSATALAALVEGELIDELRREHDVVLWSFDLQGRRVAHWPRRGGEPSPPGEEAGNRAPFARDQLAPLGMETRLGDTLAEVIAEPAGGPLAAVIVASDGGQNRGGDPLAAADEAALQGPRIVTIGVGSTEPRRNMRIQELVAPSRVYPEDKAVIRVLVQGEGYAGRTAPVELYSRESAADSAQVLIGQGEAAFDGDVDSAEVEFTIEPAVIGPLELEARLVAPPDDQFSDDNQRVAEIEVVDASTRVLLIASGASRDYRFLRNQLRRDRRASVDVWLQGAPAGISQDADAILASFPRSPEELFVYDAIVAFDPDWTQLDDEQIALLEDWVAHEAGGLIAVAGPVHTAAWLQSPLHGKIRALYPVEFERRLTALDDGLFGSQQPWPIQFTPEGQEADFLWLGNSPQESRENWQRFPGVFGYYAVRGPKPGAAVYGRFSDPNAGLVAENPVYFAEHFYGAGRVFYMGSGEMWRLRGVDPGLFEILYTQLVRHVSQGRLLRGSSYGRLLVERDRYHVGDSVLVRAQLSTANREPYVARSVRARVQRPGSPSGTNRAGAEQDTLELLADESRPGNFLGQFTVSSEGTYRIELAPPDAPDEVLVKRITANAPDLEFLDTRRNEQLLEALAARTGGEYYRSPQAAVDGDGDQPTLPRLLPSRAETQIRVGKPDLRYAERVNQALLAVICGALSLEWLLRRLFKLA
ncbi:MAG TPA: hypothetical protein PKC18_10745 [Lacipirellulaceae bacterium]|nr:hypothetical protein [Lacipirellulaceae bacterium]